jgi:hypothetical protein
VYFVVRGAAEPTAWPSYRLGGDGARSRCLHTRRFRASILARVLLGQPSLAYERRARNRRSLRHGFALALIAPLRVGVTQPRRRLDQRHRSCPSRWSRGPNQSAAIANERNRSGGSEDFERRLRRPAEAGRVGAARIECLKSERTERTVSRGTLLRTAGSTRRARPLFGAWARPLFGASRSERCPQARRPGVE